MQELEYMWKDIKELHTLYHEYIVKVYVDKSNNVVSNTINTPDTKACFVKISYTNPLKHYIHYVTLETLIEYHNTQQVLESTGNSFIDEQHEAAISSLKSTVEERFRKSLKNKIFLNYAQYLKNLFTIITSTPKTNTISSQDIYRFCETRAMGISKITHDILPILDIGTDLRIYCNIPEYATIFSETSNVIIYGREIHGKVFSIYGTIIVENNITHTVEEIRSRIHSLFGRIIINGRTVDQKHSIPSILQINNHYAHLAIRYNAKLTKTISILTGSTTKEESSQIFEISRDEIFTSKNNKNISHLKIELYNPDEQLTATIASINLQTNKLPITFTQHNDTISNILHLSLIDHNDPNSRLPIEFFLNRFKLKDAGIQRRNNTLFINKLNDKTGLYINAATKNGTILSTYGITDIVIKNTINFVILMLYDTNVTVECAFSGEIFTNSGNITVAGPVTHNSKLFSNSGSVYVGNISHRSNALAMDNSRYCLYPWTS